MTPTEQDKELREAELREAVNAKLKRAYELASAAVESEEQRKGIEFFYHVHLNSYPGVLDSRILQLIAADRKRVALEEREKARKFYAKRKPQFTKTWVADILGISRPTLDKWLKNPEQFTVGAVKKLAELKAQQEEV